ncbi:hypothetical protein [Nostoc sp.]|uniref:hypothetical protein n=1 Tax=Nostoc sp. TaxID=1180 RepID=UPI002FF936B3
MLGQHLALGIGYWALGIGHWALGIGHWAFALTGSQPLGWEPILGGSASSGLTRGRASFEYIPSLKTGNEVTQAFGLFLVPFVSEVDTSSSNSSPSPLCLIV